MLNKCEACIFYRPRLVEDFGNKWGYDCIAPDNLKQSKSADRFYYETIQNPYFKNYNNHCKSIKKKGLKDARD